MLFKVHYVNSYGRDDNAMGRSDSKLGNIYICSEMPKDIQEQTLLHEVLHIIDYNLGTKLTEEQVLALSAGMYSFFKENKL